LQGGSGKTTKGENKNLKIRTNVIIKEKCDIEDR
jgi:hypothetical protein